jgi:hypothetical protein
VSSNSNTALSGIGMKLPTIPNNLERSLKLRSSMLALVVSRQKSSNHLKKEEITHRI